MNSLYDFGLNTTQWMQETFPFLEGFFSIFHYIGSVPMYILLLPIVYWCFDKRLAKVLILLVIMSNFVNNGLKHILHEPRPFWLDDSLNHVDIPGYGIPSGHVQVATTVMVTLAIWFRDRRVWIGGVIFIALMALSRVYLGEHFVHDVILGYTIGALLVVAGLYAAYHIPAYLERYTLQTQMLLVAGAIFLMGLLYVGLLALFGETNPNVEWSRFIPAGDLEGKEATTAALGQLLGASIGVLMENRYVRFKVEGTPFQLFARYVIGIIGVVIILVGLKFIFPEEPLTIALPLRMLRYGLVLFFAAYLAPLLFIRLNIATSEFQAEPPPKIIRSNGHGK